MAATAAGSSPSPRNCPQANGIPIPGQRSQHHGPVGYRLVTGYPQAPVQPTARAHMKTDFSLLSQHRCFDRTIPDYQLTSAVSRHAPCRAPENRIDWVFQTSKSSGIGWGELANPKPYPLMNTVLRFGPHPNLSSIHPERMSLAKTQRSQSHNPLSYSKLYFVLGVFAPLREKY